jgi:uncharacterized cupredoxin-like copper-binding protein
MLPLLLLAAMATVSCSSEDGVTIRLDEYTLDVDRDREAAGAIHFSARNEGDIAHQLLVLRTDRRFDRLPMVKGVVPVGTRGIETVAEVPIIEEDAVGGVVAVLEPGKYVLICNISGHYENGMRAPFTVVG